MPGLNLSKAHGALIGCLGLAGEKVVALIEEDCGSNDIKFRKFCRLVNSKGYQLTEDQVSTFMCGGRVEEERCTSCGEKTGWRDPRVGAGVTCA